jgi:hypothetical protein
MKLSRWLAQLLSSPWPAAQRASGSPSASASLSAAFRSYAEHPIVMEFLGLAAHAHPHAEDDEAASTPSEPVEEPEEEDEEAPIVPPPPSPPPPPPSPPSPPSPSPLPPEEEAVEEAPPPPTDEAPPAAPRAPPALPLPWPLHASPLRARILPIAGALRTARAGDVLLFSCRNAPSTLQRAATRCRWDHVALVVDMSYAPRTAIDPSALAPGAPPLPRGLGLLESNGEGTRVHALAPRLAA